MRLGKGGTPMTEDTAELAIDARLARVRAVLLDALALPEWNPAFAHIEGPATAGVGRTTDSRSGPVCAAASPMTRSSRPRSG